MLYEVITDPRRLRQRLHQEHSRHDRLPGEVPDEEVLGLIFVSVKDAGIGAFGRKYSSPFRITSYNVCYTKLLRIPAAYSILGMGDSHLCPSELLLRNFVLVP